MILNMAGTWKGLFVVGLAAAFFATPVMGIEQNADTLSASAGDPRVKSLLKGSSKQQQQQGQRSLDSGGGAAYSIDFSAANPALYITTNADGELYIPFPETTPQIWGRGNELDLAIPNAKFNDDSSDVKVESLQPSAMYLGQIVPFEIKITVTTLTYPENGSMQFTAGWSTGTTNGGAYGYNGGIGVYAAFIDEADGAYTNKAQVKKANVTLFSSEVVDGEIQGIFDIEGLTGGDEVVVEVWMVLSKEWPPGGASGNVHSRLIDAKTSHQDAINTGTQTVPLMKLDEESLIAPPANLRLGYASWLEEYDPLFRPTWEEDDIALFCG